MERPTAARQTLPGDNSKHLWTLFARIERWKKFNLGLKSTNRTPRCPIIVIKNPTWTSYPVAKHFSSTFRDAFTVKKFNLWDDGPGIALHLSVQQQKV